jgi:hypothetical protein
MSDSEVRKIIGKLRKLRALSRARERVRQLERGLYGESSKARGPTRGFGVPGISISRSASYTLCWTGTAAPRRLATCDRMSTGACTTATVPNRFAFAVIRCACENCKRMIARGSKRCWRRLPHPICRCAFSPRLLVHCRATRVSYGAIVGVGCIA